MLAATIVLALTSAVFAQSDGEPKKVPKEINGTLEFAPGYRRDSLNWTIANGMGPSASPDTLSELAWERLLIYEFDTRVHVESNHGLYGKMKLGFGYITAGQNRDSDYGADGRALEWSRSNNDAKFGHTFDFSMGGGYRLIFGRKNDWSLIPMLGLSYNTQHLSIRYGRQTVSGCAAFAPGTCAPPLGNIGGLDSTYNAKWVGPWIGADVEHAWDQFLFGMGIEYHFRVKYSGSANWNLRTDLRHPVSFTHQATAQGTDITLSARYLPAPNWSIGLVAERQEFATGLGSQTTNLSDGSSSGSRLNKVRWESLTGTLSVSLRH